MNHRFTLPLLVLPAFCSSCFIPKLSVAPHIATYEVSGDIAAVAENDNISASDQASLDDLGLDSVESSYGARADFQWLGAHASISTMDAAFDGSGTADTDITIDGMTINAGTDVDTALDLTSFNAALTWDFVPTDLVDVGLGIGLMQLELDLELDPDGGSSISTDASETIPLAVLRAGVSLMGLDVGGTLGVLSADTGGFDGTIMDLDLNASYGLIGGDDHLRGAVVVGYRSFSFDSKYEDSSSEIEADFEISGPYFGVSVTF